MERKEAETGRERKREENKVKSIEFGTILHLKSFLSSGTTRL